MSDDRQTVVGCSSEAGVDTDFELIKVDIRWRETDWKDGVRVFDWTRQTQKTHVILEMCSCVTWMRYDVGDVGIDCIGIRISGKDSTKSYL